MMFNMMVKDIMKFIFSWIFYYDLNDFRFGYFYLILIEILFKYGE